MSSKKQIRLYPATFIALTLLSIGGINWGLFIFDINLVDMLAQATFPLIGTVVYGAVAVSAAWLALMLYMKASKMIG